MRYLEIAKSLYKEREKEQFTTAEKCKRLIKEIGFDDVIENVEDHGPFALVPWIGNQLLIVHDGASEEDIDKMRGQVESLGYRKELRWKIVEPRRFLALVATGDVHIGFHDKMASSIIPGKLKYYWANLPNYRNIDKALKKSGFENIGTDILR